MNEVPHKSMTSIDELLHQRIHEAMMAERPEDIFKPRVQTFEIAEQFLGRKISGNVIEVGAGNGYASIWLARERKGTVVTSLEGSAMAASELIPRNAAYHQVDHLVSARYGSFDNIGDIDTYDYAVAFGALHHSICLYSTLRSIADSLVDGGILIANEPTMPNTTPNQDYIEKYNLVQSMFGLEIKNGDRNDRFYREAEYITAAAYSGLDLLFLTDFDVPLGKKSLLRRALVVFKRHGAGELLKKVYRRISNRGKASEVKPDRYAELTSTVQTKVMIFRKRSLPYVPHKWKGLR